MVDHTQAPPVVVPVGHPAIHLGPPAECLVDLPRQTTLMPNKGHRAMADPHRPAASQPQFHDTLQDRAT